MPEQLMPRPIIEEEQGDETVGWVFGEPVTYQMLATYLDNHAPPAAVGEDPTARSRWAGRAVMTAVLARQEAGRRGLADESDLPPVVADELVGDGAPLAAEVQAYFERNRGRYEPPEQRRVRHLLCESEEKASSMAEKVRSGQALSDLARRFSTDAGSRGRTATSACSGGASWPAPWKIRRSRRRRARCSARSAARSVGMC